MSGRRKTLAAVSSRPSEKIQEIYQLSMQEGNEQEIERLGRELLESHANEWDVLDVCMRRIPSLRRIAYDQFVATYLNPQGITKIPVMVNYIEELYEDAWQRSIAFLDADHRDLSARVLGCFAEYPTSEGSRGKSGSR